MCVESYTFLSIIDPAHISFTVTLPILTVGIDDGVQSRSKYLGTTFYMSPEQKKNDRYGREIDVYTLGIIYFEMNYPFATDTGMERGKVKSSSNIIDCYMYIQLCYIFYRFLTNCAKVYSLKNLKIHCPLRYVTYLYTCIGGTITSCMQASIVAWMLTEDPQERPSAEVVALSPRVKKLKKSMKKSKAIVPKLQL